VTGRLCDLGNEIELILLADGACVLPDLLAADHVLERLVGLAGCGCFDCHGD
jgi:hypothetical protein